MMWIVKALHAGVWAFIMIMCALELAFMVRFHRLVMVGWW